MLVNVLCYNSPRSMYRYSDIAPRFSGQTSIFGHQQCCFLCIQEREKKLTILTRMSRSHARILIFIHPRAPSSWQELVQKCPCIQGSSWNFQILVFEESLETGVPGEKPLYPHMTPGLGIEPGKH